MVLPTQQSCPSERPHQSLSSAHSVLASRLRQDLLPRTNRFLSLCNLSGAPLAVYPRAPAAKFNPHHEAYYSSLGAKFYTIFEGTQETGYKRFAGEITVESDPVTLGALTWCQCKNAAYVFWESLSKLYQGDLDIDWVEWAWIPVRPRTVFVPEEDVGNESRLVHDILIIHTMDGREFVFDPTGYQFGFGDYLHEWEEYKRLFVDADLEARRKDMGIPRSRFPSHETDLYTRCDSNGSRRMQQARLEEIRLSSRYP
ncbi:Nn.00g021220.m01.CDS01 [Neocucurbitaria sp. VM-36]